MRSHPHLCEVNARLWLGELREQYGASLTLSAVPDEEWLRFKRLGVDSVWLMGVWATSPKALAISRSSESLRKELDSVCPGCNEKDIGASPYAVYDYRLNPDLGQRFELAVLHENLKRLGLRLFLDFVSNHLAMDHPSIGTFTERFIHAGPEDVKAHPDWFFETDGNKGKVWLAYGRDPNFPPWTDTVQLNYFHPRLREQMIQTLLQIAPVCDGVRCDMAMLLLNDVYESIWGPLLRRQGFSKPYSEFWRDAVRTVKDRYPQFVFLAEAYWDLEWRLQELGFDYTYDKVLYDRLRYKTAEEVRGHLSADALYQERSARFTENHDETPAVTAFGKKKSLAASVAAMTVKGMRFFHLGQLLGNPLRVPVQFLRCMTQEDEEVKRFYKKLLEITNHPAFHEGEWAILEAHPCGNIVPQGPAARNDSSSASPGRPGDETFRNLLCWRWRLGRTEKLVAVNYADCVSCGTLEMDGVSGEGSWVVLEEFSGHFLDFSKERIRKEGFPIALSPYEARIFQLEF